MEIRLVTIGMRSCGGDARPGDGVVMVVVTVVVVVVVTVMVVLPVGGVMVVMLVATGEGADGGRGGEDDGGEGDGGAGDGGDRRWWYGRVVELVVVVLVVVLVVISMVVLVMRRAVAAVTDSDAPFGASLVRNVLSLMLTTSGPEVAMAPPFLALTRNSELVHIALPHGHHPSQRLYGSSGEWHTFAPKVHPGN